MEERPRRLVRVPEMWLEAPIDDDWVIAYRLVAQQGRLVIGELRIIPAEPARPDQEPGTWSGEFLGLQAGDVVPRGGITSALRNRIRVGLHVDQLAQMVAKLRRAYGEGADAWFQRVSGAAPPLERHRRASSADDSKILRVAQAYAAVVQSRDPIQRVARRLRLDATTVRRRVHQARGRGYLTSTNQGVRAGELTETARAALRAQAEKRGTRHGKETRTR